MWTTYQHRSIDNGQSSRSFDDQIWIHNSVSRTPCGHSGASDEVRYRSSIVTDKLIQLVGCEIADVHRWC
jgi:hypothetical protein